MPNKLDELRERLLRGGVAPRHVRRYVRELREHLADLTAEERAAGRAPADAESAALARLGNIDDLAEAMIGQRQFRSWTNRAPWLTFGAGSLAALGAAYLIACSLLLCGWKLFLPAATLRSDTRCQRRCSQSSISPPTNPGITVRRLWLAWELR